jgi:hypothetical protein
MVDSGYCNQQLVRRCDRNAVLQDIGTIATLSLPRDNFDHEDSSVEESDVATMRGSYHQPGESS